jgi:uncharacterized protein
MQEKPFKTKDLKNIPRKSWLNPKVSVKKSPIHGLGLFATKPIKKDEIVMILGGKILTDLEVEDKVNKGERYDGIALGTNLNLSIEPRDWPGIHGNHSCNPNLWMKEAVTITARHDIGLDEELTTDYAVYTIHPKWSMKCNCGSNLCRKLITGHDWRLPELQERYRGHLSPIVEMLIGPG